MKRSCCLTGAAFLFAWGCAGGGGSSPPPASPYAGTFSGSYEAVLFGEAGAFTITIDREGDVTGTMNREAGDAEVVGTISDAGRIDVQLKFPDDTADQLVGPLTLTEEGRLSGTIGRYKPSGYSASMSLDLLRQ